MLGTDQTLTNLTDAYFSAFQPRRRRSMRQWAEDEIVIPTGQYAGSKFRCHRQPFTGHWLDAVDSGAYTEIVTTGPSQSGKSLLGFVIPTLYHLFESREDVVAAVPTDDLVRAKWQKDLEPVIARTRYRDLIPRTGVGSKGGRAPSITFANGSTLHFLTGGGSDKSRAAITVRVVVMTETDGFDLTAETSEEGTKIDQIGARTRSFPRADRRYFKECTLSTDQGHTWQRYKAGTASQLMLPCPHCRGYVRLEREHLVGWDAAEDVLDAQERSWFGCAACGEKWTEDERKTANANALLIHDGQSIEGGKVVGVPKRTGTFGFRWSAVNNLLTPASDLGADEFEAKQQIDEEKADRKMRQFVWAMPVIVADDRIVQLDPDAIAERQAVSGRGQIPTNATHVTVGIDLGLKVAHWVAIAWLSNGSAIVIDYGTTGVQGRKLGTRRAFRKTLQHLHAKFGEGWTPRPDGTLWKPDACFVDCKWETDDVVAAVAEVGDARWRPAQGFAEKSFAKPKKVSEKGAIWIGEDAFEFWDGPRRTYMIYANADHWKFWVSQRLALDFDAETREAEIGGIVLFSAVDEKTHREYTRHLTAEHMQETFEAGKTGPKRTFVQMRRQNHFGDGTYLACVAGNRLGVTIERKPAPVAAAPPVEPASQHVKGSRMLGMFSNRFFGGRR